MKHGNFETEAAANPSPDAASNQAIAPDPEPEPVERSPQPLSILHRVLLALGFLSTATVAATLGMMVALMMPLSGALVPEGKEANVSLQDLWRKGVRHQVSRPVTILVMGIDEVPDAEPGTDEIFEGRSDTMLLVRVNPDDHSVNVLSIPRDTQVEFPGRRGVTKINHANYVGGPRLAADVIDYNLNGVTVDRYVRFSTGAFRELVDVLGGVDIYVPQPMRYTDETQGLYIDLEQGQQVLNGDQAEQFARFRSDAYGDIGRVQRQQQLIGALRDRLTSPAVIPRVPQIIQLVNHYIDTNLTPEEMLALTNFALDLNSENLKMVLLPGQFSSSNEYVASYWLMDRSGVAQVMSDFFQVSTYSEARLEARSLNDLRIAVQNASGEPLVATEVVRYLQDQGFDNVYAIQDWPDRQSQTQIIVQRGNLQSATMLEHVLGTGRVIAASTGDLQSDLTIRIGADWGDRSDI